MRNLLDGMGYPYELIGPESVNTTNLDSYQLVVIAGSMEKKLPIDASMEKTFARAMEQGVNFLWIGRGIWGSFKTGDLQEAFGIRYIDQTWSDNEGISQACFQNIEGHTDSLIVHKEMIYRIKPDGAEVEDGILMPETRRVKHLSSPAIEPQNIAVSAYTSPCLYWLLESK